MIRIMCVIFISYQYILKIECANICRHDQIMRRDNQGNYICCQTIICQKGQMYAFCDSDKGHDTCSNCPEGTYHLDTINTAMMNSILNPCIPKPTCDQPEVKLENGECVCDRSRGYYGNDINNCLLADHKCSGPGYELKDNGKCEPCAEDYFKPEAGADNVCRRKTRCFETQEIDNNGTTTKDRSCRAKTVPIAIVEHQNNKNDTENVMDAQQSIILSAVVVVLVALFGITYWCWIRRNSSNCNLISNNFMMPPCNKYEITSRAENDKLYDQIHAIPNVEKSVDDSEETCVMTLYQGKDSHAFGTDYTVNGTHDTSNNSSDFEYYTEIADHYRCKNTELLTDTTTKQGTKTTDYITSLHDFEFNNQAATHPGNRKGNFDSRHGSTNKLHRCRTSEVELESKRISNKKHDKVSINTKTPSTRKTENVDLHEKEESYRHKGKCINIEGNVKQQKRIAGKTQIYSESHMLKSTKVSSCYNDNVNVENKILTTKSSSTRLQTKNVKKEDKKLQTSFEGGLLVIEDNGPNDTITRMTTSNTICEDNSSRRNGKIVATIKPILRQNTGSSSDDSEFNLLNTIPVNDDESRKVATSRAPRPVDSESMSSSWSIENTNNQENDGSAYEIESYLITTEMCPPVDSFEFASANQNDNEDNEDVH